MKKLNVMLCNSESRHPLREWKDVLSAQILDFGYHTPSRAVKIVKKNGEGNVFVLPAANNTVIIEEFKEE